MRYLIVQPNQTANRGAARTHVVEAQYRSAFDGESFLCTDTLTACGIMWGFSESRWITVDTYKQPTTARKKITCQRCRRSFDKARKK